MVIQGAPTTEFLDSGKETTMLNVYAGSWWTLLLRGIAAVAFGVLAFVWPGITLTALVFLWGAYALVDGAFAIVAGVKSHGESSRWWVLLLEGILGVLAGIVAFTIPGITALVLLLLIAAWAIITGAFEIAAAIQMRKYIRGEWLLVLAGVCSILFGALLFLNPAAGALAVVWLIGAYAIVFGILLIALSLRLHGLMRSPDRMSPRPV
jgi:uncharacterized membrane protein HdeD (DUF308 family)